MTLLTSTNKISQIKLNYVTTSQHMSHIREIYFTMSSDLDQIGSRLLKIRKTKGHSQAKTAAILDVSDRSYKSYELGKRDMTFSTATKFANGYDVSLDWLAFGEGEEELKRTDDVVLTVACRSYECINGNSNYVSSDQFKSYVRYIVDQSRKNGSDPIQETDNFFITLGFIDAE